MTTCSNIRSTDWPPPENDRTWDAISMVPRAGYIRRWESVSSWDQRNVLQLAGRPKAHCAIATKLP